MTSRDPLLGAVLADQYRIVEVIGHGGMGAVYRARQISVNRDVALKVLRAELAEDEESVRRFETEAAAVSRLRHPNTVRFYDYRQTTGGELFIVTEYLHGAPLTAYLDAGSLDLQRAMRVIDQVCASLSEAHAMGVLHRDVKPANVFVDRVDDHDLVKVLDFGLAKLGETAADVSAPGRMIGTPAYMSPEQVRGDPVDHRTDIYSVGVMLYQLLTRRTPFIGDTPITVCFKHLHEPPPSLTEVAPWAEIPAPVEALVMRMLAKDPNERPSSMLEVRRALALASPEATRSALDTLAFEVTTPSRWSLPRPQLAIGAPPEHGLALRAQSSGGAIAPISGGTVAPIAGLPPPISPLSMLPVPTEDQSTWPPASISTSIPLALQTRSAEVRWRLLGGLAAALAAVVVSVASFVEHQISHHEPYTISIGERAVAADPPQPMVSAKLVSEPAGAVVYGADGERLGTAPLTVQFHGNQAYHLMFASGRAVIVKLDPTRDSEQVIHVAEPAASRPEAKEAPKPRPAKVKTPAVEAPPAAEKADFDAPLPVSID